MDRAKEAPADAGGRDSYRRAAPYADRILKSARLSELPIQAPVTFELVINLKTAKVLGLDVPWFLQQRADEVMSSRPSLLHLLTSAAGALGRRELMSAITESFGG